MASVIFSRFSRHSFLDSLSLLPSTFASLSWHILLKLTSPSPLYWSTLPKKWQIQSVSVCSVSSTSGRAGETHHLGLLSSPWQSGANDLEGCIVPLHMASWVNLCMHECACTCVCVLMCAHICGPKLLFELSGVCLCVWSVYISICANGCLGFF